MKSLKEVLDLCKEFVSPDISLLWRIACAGHVEQSAKGTIIFTNKGQLLDFVTGYGVMSLGHRHPRVISAVRDQLDIMPMSSRALPNALLVELAQKLASITPGDLQYSFFCNSGTEAVEAALKMARITTGRPEFVSMDKAFHGKTFGALSVSGREQYREPFQPLLQGTRRVPFNDLSALSRAVTEKTAAVIVEPVQGEGGIILAQPGYLAGVKRICEEKGALMIADEVQTGLGRTGKMFAVEHEGIDPDIMCLAKALGGGVMPIGAIVSTKEAMAGYKGNPLLHTSTFGGNPLACRAAIATIDTIQGEDLLAKSAQSGAYLLAQLKQVAEKNPDIISDVRGLGLLIGVEFCDEGKAGKVMLDMLKNGVIALYTMNQKTVIRFEPPLNVSKEHINTAVEVFTNAVETSKV